MALAVASVFDPQYKMVLINYYCREIYGCDADVMIKRVHTAVYDLYSEYVVDSPMLPSMGFVDSGHGSTSYMVVEEDTIPSYLS